MGIFDRIILTIYTFVLMFLSLSIMAFSLKLVSPDIIWTRLQYYIYGTWEAALIGLMFFLVSIRLLITGVTPGRNRQSIVRETALGQVQISLSAIESLVQKVARQIKGVRGVKSYITHSEQGIGVHIKAVVSPEASIPNVSDEIQNRIRDHILSVVGTPVADVQIFIENISNEVGNKPRSRVE